MDIYDHALRFFFSLAMKSFDQLVNHPTHIEGGFLDHLFVRKVETVRTFLHHPYCTDHDGVLALFKLNQDK